MKSPAFQFYPTDYLASQRVQMMTLEEEGAYCRLLCYCWQHGSIPSDPELAARLVGKGCSTTVARVVLPMFEVACGDGRVTHDRLERERAKQAEWREKSSAGGKKSAQMRQESKGGSTVAQPPYQPNGNIPVSSFQSPSSKEERGGIPPQPQPPTNHDHEAEKRKAILEQIQSVFDAWNRLEGFPKCLLVSDGRRRKLEVRLRDPFFFSNWRNGIEKLQNSKFLMGESERGWKATFDWFIKPESLLRIIEGKYDNHAQSRRRGPNI